ncbi:hypothetical protein LEQ41_10610 [Streptococcus agalactiae]|nr:hypothetical protein [Streptococcus agalactiae]
MFCINFYSNHLLDSLLSSFFCLNKQSSDLKSKPDNLCSILHLLYF